MSLLNSTINLIFWKKKDNDYQCFTSNCDIKEGYKLKKYKYYDRIKKTFENKEYQCIHLGNLKLIIEYLNGDIVTELQIPIDESLYLLSTISHKVRNPLTNIMGAINILEETLTNRAHKKQISLIKKSSYEIIEVANDIIDIINLSRGEIRFHLDDIVLEKMILECIDIVRGDIKEKNLSINFSIDSNVPRKINVDTKRLKQIILNMLDNAINNTLYGTVHLKVSLFKKQDSVDYFTFMESKPPIYNLIFRIKDTGQGIDNESKGFVDNILSIKSSVTDINNNKLGGFGLLISKNLCNLMGGNIWFKSEQDIGTIFYFNIICEASN